MRLYENSFANFKQNYYGAAAMSIIVQSCVGGAAVMFILSNGTAFFQIVQLTIITVLCMAANTAMLAQFSQKTVFNLLIISVLTSVLLIFLNAAIL